MTIRIDPGNVQGNVLRSYGRAFTHTRYLFVSFRRTPLESPAAREFLASLLDSVSFGARRDPSAKKAMEDVKRNLAFSYRGLRNLGGVLPADMLASFPDDFRAGARARADKLGDSWQKKGQETEGQGCQNGLEQSHVLLSFHSCCEHTDHLRARTCAAVTESERVTGDPVFPHAFVVTHTRDAVASEDRREGFGFRDGISQPAIEGTDANAVGTGVYVGTQPRSGIRRRLALLMGNFTLEPRPQGWRPIRAGEFLLGYENEDGELPAGPPSPLGPDGTFMVYREFDQDVEGFDTYVKGQADRTVLDAEVLRAKIVGRWLDGSPAARRPDDIQPRSRLNDFHYRSDPNGWGCPVGAHVRRTNPRDSLPGGGEQTMRHRIIRRGMPFVEPFNSDEPERTGLAFVCLGASIADGFEFIQRNWINSGAAFGLGSTPDFLLQHQAPMQPMVIPGYHPIVLEAPSKPFVTVRGCEYFFVPSRAACEWLAARLRR